MQEAVAVTSPATSTGGRHWLRNEQSPLWASVPTERPVIKSSRLPYIGCCSIRPSLVGIGLGGNT